MKYFNTLIIFALLFTMGCNEERIEVEHQIADEMMAREGRTKTIRIREASGMMEYIPGASECNQFGGGILVRITGTGKAAGLGNFSVISTVCQNPLGNISGPFLFTLMAKNGDQIDTQVTNITPDTEDPKLSYYDGVVLGGTGRFEKVTGGAITMFGELDYDNNVWSLEGEGIFEY